MNTVDLLLVAMLVVLASILMASAKFRLLPLLGAVVLSAFVYPRGVLGASALDGIHVGIAAPSPRVMTYSIAFAVVMLTCLAVGRRTGGLAAPVVPLIVFVSIWGLFVWDSTGAVHSGIVHILTGCVGWIVGLLLAAEIEKHPRGMKLLAGAVVGLILLQAAVTIAQTAGVPMFESTSVIIEDAALEGRASGTLGHPSTVGKVVFLMAMVLLPLGAHQDRGVRVTARLGFLASLIPLLLSGGRANAAAVLATVACFVVLDPGASRWGNRWKVMYGALVVGAVSGSYWVQRFAEGEDGSFRRRFNETAWQYIQMSDWWRGAGPNSYVSAVGPLDPLAAQGWVVHNFALLAAVELGFIGALLICWPFVYAVGRAWRRRRQLGHSGAFARAVVAAFPGLLLITMTGWGMMSGMFAPWMMVTALCLRLAGQRTAKSEDATPGEKTGEVKRSSAGRVPARR